MRNDGRSWGRGQGRGQGIVGRHVFDCEVTTARSPQEEYEEGHVWLSGRFCPLSSCKKSCQAVCLRFRAERSEIYSRWEKITIEIVLTMNLPKFHSGTEKGIATSWHWEAKRSELDKIDRIDLDRGCGTWTADGGWWTPTAATLSTETTQS